jgi:hypothetical protein
MSEDASSTTGTPQPQPVSWVPSSLFLYADKPQQPFYLEIVKRALGELMAHPESEVGFAKDDDDDGTTKVTVTFKTVRER